MTGLQLLKLVVLLVTVSTAAAIRKWPPRGCYGDAFRCNNGQCLPGEKKCDGQYDCGGMDHSDEDDCPIPYEPECEGIGVMVNSEAPEEDYTMSMMATNDYCGPYDMSDMLKMLAGSGRKWYGRCKKVVPHIITIEATKDCRGDEWMVEQIAFRLKGVKKVTIYVGDQQIVSEMCGYYFYFNQKMTQPGSIIVIEILPKSKYFGISDLQVHFCCVPHTTTPVPTTPPAPTTTVPIPSTTLAPTRKCNTTCIPVPPEELVQGDITCDFVEPEPPCMWICNGTCFEDTDIGTDVGTTLLSTTVITQPPADIHTTDPNCKCCNAVSGSWEFHPIECSLDDQTTDGTFLIYRIDQCECEPCTEPTPPPPPPSPTPTYGPVPYPPYPPHPYPPYGPPPPHYGPPPPHKPPYGPAYEYDYEDPYGPYPPKDEEYNDYPPYGPWPPKRKPSGYGPRPRRSCPHHGMNHDGHR